MDNITKQEFDLDSSDIISFINSRKKPLLILSLIALVISIVISFLIDPLYESKVVLFPSSPTSISQSLVSSNNKNNNLLQFGDEEDAEKLVQILNSRDIKLGITTKFNLYTHYEIDADAEFRIYELNKELEDNITFNKTEYLSVEVRVLDKNPQVAADIANYITFLLDSVINDIKKDRAVKTLQVVKDEYDDEVELISSLNDSLTIIRKKGVLDYESQSEVMNDAYAIALAEGQMSGAKKIEEKLLILAQYGGAYVALRDMLVLENRKLAELESRLKEAKVNTTQIIPNIFIVDKAQKAEKKKYPIRWLVVSLFTLSTFLLSLLLLILYSKFKKNKF